MKKIVPLIILATIAIFTLLEGRLTLPSLVSDDSSTQGNVQRVVDGDTLELRDGTKVRLIGINTPEKGEPYGEEAINETRRLVTNKEIRLKYDEEQKDAYNRTLAYVYIGDTHLNKLLVEKGLALVETVPPNELYEGDFMEAELEAQENCRGLWEGLCVAGEHTNTCIKISQIQADAPGNDNENKNGEWIEFTNSCQEDIPLDGYFLKDRSASNSYFFKNATVAANSSIRLYSGCDTNKETDLYWQCPEKRSSVWNNESDSAYLYDNQGMLITTYSY